MELWKRVPGLTKYLTQDVGEIRGFLWLEFSQQLMIVAGNKVGFYSGVGEIDWRGGTIDGEGPVTIARNNNAETDIVITTGSNTYVVRSTSVQQYPDGNVGVPNSVSFLDAYLVFTYADGTIRASDVNVTDIPGLSYTRAESSPDGLLRGVTSRRFFYAMGSSSIEIYQNVGNIDFPFQRVYVLDTGLYGQFAVAGDNVDGWDNPILFVASDGTVRALQDYQSAIISTDAVSRDILSADKNDIFCFCYNFDANPVFVVTSSLFTWEYNLKTQGWHERRSFNRFMEDTWRGKHSVQAFDKWLVADKETGVIYQIDPAELTEDGKPLVYLVESETMTGFPQQVACRRLDLDFAVGYGSERGLDPIEIDPTIDIIWSTDGGVSYGVPVQRKLGREGRYSNLVSVLGLGQSFSQGWRFIIRISDPIDCSLKGGFMNSEARMA